MCVCVCVCVCVCERMYSYGHVCLFFYAHLLVSLGEVFIYLYLFWQEKDVIYSTHE